MGVHSNVVTPASRKMFITLGVTRVMGKGLVATAMPLPAGMIGLPTLPICALGLSVGVFVLAQIVWTIYGAPR